MLASSVRELCERCDLVVTATASTRPLISAEWIGPGTHITAVGADVKGKQELDPQILGRADIRAVDSVAQCVDHGELGHAVAAKLVMPEDLVELGSILAGAQRGRSSPEQITVADLTGLAVQDLQIAKAVWHQVAQMSKLPLLPAQFLRVGELHRPAVPVSTSTGRLSRH